MKKVVLFFAVVSAFALASCDTKPAEQKAEETVATVDSVVADVIDSTAAAVDSAAAVVDSAATAVVDDSAAAAVAAVVE